MACLAMDVLLAVLFSGAFITTILTQKPRYFNGGEGKQVVPGGETTFKVSKRVVDTDVAMEVLRMVTLIIMFVIGRSERNLYLEGNKEIPTSDAAGSRWPP